MKKITTFQMESGKFNQLKKMGFTTEEIIILKEELGKAKKR